MPRKPAIPRIGMMIRLTPEAREKLERLALQAGTDMTAVLEKLIRLAHWDGFTRQK